MHIMPRADNGDNYCNLAHKKLAHKNSLNVSNKSLQTNSKTSFHDIPQVPVLL